LSAIIARAEWARSKARRDETAAVVRRVRRTTREGMEEDARQTVDVGG